VRDRASITDGGHSRSPINLRAAAGPESRNVWFYPGVTLMRSTHRASCGAAILIAAAVAAAALSSVSNGKVAATFSGTVPRDGLSAHSFTILRAGSVTATLTRLGPASGQAIGFGLGTPTGAGNCALVETLDAAHVTAELGGTLRTGTYCVAVYDAGEVTAAEPLDYTISVIEK
jgi:hypothetical protein